MGSLLIFILILIVLIIAHEFGHFVVAKLFGIRVDEFGIFFPPRLLAKQWGETTYTINALPFGGFVKIFGETSEDAEASSDPRSFINKNRAIQASVLLAGIVFNLIAAWLLLSACYMIGVPTFVDHQGVGTVTNAKPTVVSILPDSPADKAGLKPEDIITSIESGTAQLPAGATADQVTQFIGAHQDESLVLNIDRNGQQLNFLAKPVDGLVPGKKAIGIETDDLGILKLSLPLALVQGAVYGEEITVLTVQSFGGLVASIFHGHADLSQVAGPVGIAKIGSAAVRQGPVMTMLITALISINLAIFNVLPIPGLDGGRLLLVVIEAIRRKPISEKLMVQLTIGGLSFIVLLALLVTYHDIIKLIHPAA